MSDIIHLLPDTVANQIAAGEVVQRPSSVLKELVENSLDAGAQHIDIIVRDAGRTLLKVIDDGKGMSPTDARMAFERHATSKISTATDLFNLQTMGFRGEALASIAAVSQVDMTTRRPEDELGTKIEMAGATVISQDYCQCPYGTAIAVKNLFFNTPARRRFLKTNSTELKNLFQDFYRIALVYPKVHFTFTANDEQVFNLEPGTTKQRIAQLLGKTGKTDFYSQLLTIDTETELLSIKGYIGKPESAQKNPYQYLFVNGRYMRHPYFHKAVINAYQGLIANDVQPHYFIYFSIAAQDIDVNIHPTKTEIKFADEQSIWPLLYAAVRETLGKYDARPSLDFDQTDAPDIPTYDPRRNASLTMPSTGYDGYDPFKSSEQRTVDKEQRHESQNRNGNQETRPWKQETGIRNQDIQNWQRLYEGFQSHSELSQQQLIEQDDIALICQLDNKWLLCRTATELVLIDQHRAHTRVLYDHYTTQSGKQQASQQLLFPELWQINIDKAAIVREMLDDIKSLGFEIQKFGNTAFSVTAVPAELGDGNPIEALNDILATATEQTTNTTRQQKMALALARNAAIRAGQQLNATQQAQLLEQWLKTPMKAITPEGKNIMLTISFNEITRRI
ncbi:MAG TPA: DNA mismatch repair endonuclease MutL [Bacteroidales bacterium]|nr:DNA mismatch repair endonuclease MutL [Bacteroidales bacterium]